MYERKDQWSVGEWMTSVPETVSPDTSVRSAFIKMRTGNYRHLLVVHHGELLGIVTDRDLRRPDLSDEPEGWLDSYNLEEDYEVSNVMTSEVDTIRTHDSLEKALRLLLEHKYGALPVLDKKGSAIGILTTYDLLAAFDRALAEASVVLRERVS